MKIVFRTWLFLVFVCAAFSVGAAPKEVHDVSIIRLIAAPKDYNQKTVRVVGFLNIGFEGDAIYFHEEDFRRGLINNGLGIRAKPQMTKQLEKLTGQYVVIEGVFDASRDGQAPSFSSFHLLITDITRADAWNVGPSPTPPP